MRLKQTVIEGLSAMNNNTLIIERLLYLPASFHLKMFRLHTNVLAGNDVKPDIDLEMDIGLQIVQHISENLVKKSTWHYGIGLTDSIYFVPEVG